MSEPTTENAALTAENARLRAEVEEEKRLREVWRSSSFNNEAFHREDVARIVSMESQIMALRADLARVTAERAVVAAAREFLDSEFTWLAAVASGADATAQMDAAAMAMAGLRSAVAACAPPASGEEG